MSFKRPRRLRANPALRELVRETRLSPADLVYPLFVKEGLPSRQPIQTMPGVFQLSVAEAVKEAGEAWRKGIKGVILFGIPSKKDAKASQAYSKNGIVQKAISEIKRAHPDMIVVGDVCLCEYMDHGHCGVVDKKGIVDNDASLDLLARTALTQAEAGADIIAPSDMMDGRIKRLREVLDSSGFSMKPIMSYAVKSASAFYGPFREAAESAPKFGDRKTYQMDPANLREALHEAKLDEGEGADILLVKPAGPSLDIISKVAAQTNLPVAAYQVSGEYAMIKAAANNGWILEEAVAMESLLAIKRAGAKMIITYFAKDIAEKL